MAAAGRIGLVAVLLAARFGPIALLARNRVSDQRRGRLRIGSRCSAEALLIRGHHLTATAIQQCGRSAGS